MEAQAPYSESNGPLWDLHILPLWRGPERGDPAFSELGWLLELVWPPGGFRSLKASLMPVSPVDIGWDNGGLAQAPRGKGPIPAQRPSLVRGECSWAAASLPGDHEPGREDALAAQVCL